MQGTVMLTHNITIAAAGFLSVLIVLWVRLRKREAVDANTLATLGAAFLTGTNIPVSLFLCCYPFDPDPATVATKLHGFEKYIGLAGLSLFVLSAISLWSLCKPAEVKVESAKIVNPLAPVAETQVVETMSAPNPSLKRTPNGAA